MSREELENKIEALKEQIKDLHGTPCEVYSRVVGYLRPVGSWNRGKKEEYHLRKNYDVEHCCK